MSSSVPSAAQVFFDLGRGENEQDSSTATLDASPTPRVYRFPIPAGQTIVRLRFDALSGAGTVRILSARLVVPSGAVVREFSHADFTPRYQFVESATDAVSSTFATTTPAPGQVLDPALAIRLDQPVRTGSQPGRFLVSLLVFVLAVPLLAGCFRWLPRDPDRRYRLAVKSAMLF